ncbi:MAG: hypothetical protein AAF725_23220, partial [Acidobacteriota bacterium]
TAPVYAELGRVALGQMALFTLINADLIIAPRLLEGDTLAAYGKAAMLGRAVIFLPLPVVLAMFPRAVVSTRRRLLALPMLFVALTAAATASLVAWRPELPLGLIYGATEAAAPGLARLYVWAAIPLALVEVAVPYLWARDRPWAVAALLVPATAFLGVLLLLGGQPERIILALAAAGWGILTIALVLVSRGPLSPSGGLR